MPGYVIHLAVAERIIKKCNMDDTSAYFFRIGSIAPDTQRTGEKKMSHFWSDETLRHFMRKPDLNMFLSKYGHRLSEPYVYGYYTHLFLDYRFVNEYWRKHYLFYDDNEKPCDDYDRVSMVHYIDHDVMIKRDIFFSDSYYYGDYDRMNMYLIKKYNIVPPAYRCGVLSEGGIAEVDNKLSESNLKEMLDRLGRTASYKKDADCTEPLLQVFDMTELTELIEAVTENMTETGVLALEQ